MPETPSTSGTSARGRPFGPTRSGSPSRRTSFRIYWFGQSLSLLGDAIAGVATPLLVLEATGSLVMMGLLSAWSGVWLTLSGVYAGVLVDRVDRRRLMIGCDCVRVLTWSSIWLAWVLLGPQLWMLFVATAIGSLLERLFQIATVAAIPEIVDKDQIVPANSWLAASYGATILLGPAVAGLVCAHWRPITALGLNALSFGVSAVSLLLVRVRVRRQPEPGRWYRSVSARELLAGVRFLVNHSVLRWMLVLVALADTVMAARVELIVFYLRHDLGRNETEVGLFFSLFALGAVIGSIVTPALRRRIGLARCFLAASSVIGLSIWAFGAARTLWIVAAAGMTYMFSDAVRGIVSKSYRQECTPDRLLGRVSAAHATLINIPLFLGAAASTALAARIGVSTLLTWGGAFVVALAVLGALTPVRDPARAPAIEPD